MTNLSERPDRAQLTTRLHLPFPRHNHTTFIALDPGLCDACWECIESCPRHVLGMVDVMGHRHAHIDHASACKGCQTCVTTCPRGAFRFIYQPRPRRERRHRRNDYHHSTRFIALDTHQCEACWACIEVCPTGVLGKVDFLGHRHARIDDADACNGCKRCVRACPSGALIYTYRPVPREARQGNRPTAP